MVAGAPWDFWRSLGSPKYVCAPMVDQSELAFRTLTRQLGVGLAYTPMLHARLMIELEVYRAHTFDPEPRDRPLFAQLAGHDPAVLLEAGRHVQGHVDAVDINFGCPQARAWPASRSRRPSPLLVRTPPGRRPLSSRCRDARLSALTALPGS